MRKKQMLQLSTVEDELSRQGYFCLLDWLLTQNFLAYADYEAWRYGHIDTLDGCFQHNEKELDELTRLTESYASSLKLEADPVDYFGWDDKRAALYVSESVSRHQGMVWRWQRAQDIPQMDLFMDNSTLIAENALGDALAGRNWDAAEEALQRLTRLNPGHRQLGAYADLLNYGRHMQGNMKLSPAAIAPELDGLRQEVSPLAKELLRANARDYLAFAWRRMADNLGAVAFDPDQPELHLSYVLGQIPDWQQLKQTLIADPRLHRQPKLLERLAACFSATGQHASASAVWCLLFDRFTDYAEAAVEEHRQQAVYALWEDFWELHEHWQPALFASFLLIAEPGLLHHLQQLPPLGQEANLAAVELLEHRRRGESETLARKELQSLSPEMLSFFLSRLG
jgi:hypothetical protein